MLPHERHVAVQVRDRADVTLLAESDAAGVRGESYAEIQRPSRLAPCTSRTPAGFMRPALMSRSALVRLILDQMLCDRRGVNFCSHHAASNGRFCPSIQP